MSDVWHDVTANALQAAYLYLSHTLFTNERVFARERERDSSIFHAVIFIKRLSDIYGCWTSSLIVDVVYCMRQRVKSDAFIVEKVVDDIRFDVILFLTRTVKKKENYNICGRDWIFGKTSFNATLHAFKYHYIWLRKALSLIKQQHVVYRISKLCFFFINEKQHPYSPHKKIKSP